MSRAALLFALFSVGLLALPAADAIMFRVEVDDFSGPIARDGPTQLDVTVRAKCSDVAQEGDLNLQFTLASGYPEWLRFNPDTVPMTEDDCDPATVREAEEDCPPGAGFADCAQQYPYAETSGHVTLRPLKSAPGLVPFTVRVVVKDHEGFDDAVLRLEYVGNLTMLSNETRLTLSATGNATGSVFMRAATNGNSTLNVTVVEAPAKGTLISLPTSFMITPPRSPAMIGMAMPGDNDTPIVDETIPVQYSADSGEWDGDNFTLKFELRSMTDPSQVAAPLTVEFSVGPAPKTDTKGNGKSPVPIAAAFVAAVAAAALLRRRRA